MKQHASTISKPLGFKTGFQPQEFYYSLPWRAQGLRAGSHLTTQQGQGAEFSGFTPFMQYPEPRRLDLRASLRTIPRQYIVRRFLERVAVKAYAVLDLSSSMRYSGSLDKRSQAFDIVASIAWSATRQGDSFGLLAGHDRVVTALEMPARFRKNSVAELQEKVQSYRNAEAAKEPVPVSRTALALPEMARALGSQRSLVFLISDFHWPEDFIKKTLSAYAGHDVVPLLLWDSSEFRQLPAWGLTRVRDMESGQEMSLLMRKSLHARIEQNYLERKLLISRVCREVGCRKPLLIEHGYDARLLTRHLLEGLA